MYFQKLTMISTAWIGRVLVLGCLMLLVQPQEDGERLESLCEPDAEIPDTLIKCGSCDRRCGSKSSPNHLWIPSWWIHTTPHMIGACACDKFCGFHVDCCQDFQQFCPDEFLDFRNRSDLYPFSKSLTTDNWISN